jgi:serine/threonine protein kinase
MDRSALTLAFESTPYELLRRIGEGGFGEVWLARRRATEDLDSMASDADSGELAIKILHEAHGSLGPKLQHENIVQVLDEGAILGRPYQVMERVPGGDLRQQLRRGPLELMTLRRLSVALLSALDHAHTRGIIHRDLKPENVLIDNQQRPWKVKLSDFGLATRIGDELRRSASLMSVEGVAGTARYIAPELLREGKQANARSDLYSFGVLLFECLTGQLPGGLELPGELRRGLPRGLDSLIKSLLASRPELRPESALEVQRRVLHIFRSQDDPETVTASFVRRRRPEELPLAIAPTARSKLDEVLIPAGTFVQGDSEDPFASPRRMVNLPAFTVARNLVTNAEFLAYVQATGAPAPRSWKVPAASWSKRSTIRLTQREAPLPVTGVTWLDAESYARWRRCRLLSEAEWERVAQGPQGWAYPWGDEARDEIGASFETSLEGVCGLGGGLWEWCADWFDRRAYAGPKEVTDPRGPASGDARVIRGGFDKDLPGSGTAFYRGSLRPELSHPRLGFRLARDVELADSTQSPRSEPVTGPTSEPGKDA